MKNNFIQNCIKYSTNKFVKFYLLSLFVMLFIIVIKICLVDFQDNDDYIYTMIMSGVYSGAPSPMTVYEGYYYGYFISSLYRLFSYNIEWYIVVMHSLYIISFIVIIYRLLDSKLSSFVKIVTSISGFFFQIYLLLSPQFTILAGEIALSAAVLLIGNIKKWNILLSIILIVIGIQIRFSAFMMVFVPLLPIILLSGQYKKDVFWRKIFFIGGIVLLSVAVNYFSNLTYYKNRDWDYYMSYNKPRGVIEQHLCKEDAIDMFIDDIQKNEYTMLCKSGLIDGSLISISEMNKCADFVQTKKKNLFRLNIAPYYYGLCNHCLWFFIIWFIGLFIFAIKQKRYRELLVTSFSIIILILELLYCMNATFVKERIIICIIFCMFFLGAILSFQILGKKQLIYISAIACVIISTFYIRKTYIWENEVECRLENMNEINILLKKVPVAKVHILGIPLFADAYSVSTTPALFKYIGKGWLNNFPLHRQFYKNYKSLVNGIPIVKAKGESENIRIIENVLENYYHSKVVIKVLSESKHYEVIQFVNAYDNRSQYSCMIGDNLQL